MTETQRIVSLRAALTLAMVRAAQSRSASNAWEWGAALKFIDEHCGQALKDDDAEERRAKETER